MNSEKILVLYKETALLNEQFKKNLQSARIIYQDINEFNHIQGDNEELRRETSYMLKDVKSVLNKRNTIITVSVFFSSLLIGIIVGYLVFLTTLKDIALAHEYETFNTFVRKNINELSMIQTYKEKGFKFNKDYLEVPYKYKLKNYQYKLKGNEEFQAIVIN